VTICGATGSVLSDIQHQGIIALQNAKSIIVLEPEALLALAEVE